MIYPKPLFLAESLDMKPSTVFSIGYFEVTSSMIVSVIAAVVIITITRLAMRNPQLVPGGLQNLVEWIVECLSNLLESILGRKLMERSFWFFATVFIFILGCNIISLFPGVGTYGRGHGEGWTFEVDQPFLRGANADVNMTAAMTTVFFFLSFYWAFTSAGVVGFLSHTFGSKVKFQNSFANWLFVGIFFLVGFIEIISIFLIRPLAFTFRLYGNIYGGEYLLDSIYKLAPNFAFILLVPFYGLELLVAFIQASVFCILTAVFTSLMCQHDDHSASPEETAH